MANKQSSFSTIIDEDQMPETEASKEFLNFFVDELKDIYWAEKQLAKILLKMQKAATASKLKTAFAAHLVTTRVHAERLEEIFDLLGETPRMRESEGIAALVDEVNSSIEETEKGSDLRDTCLVISAQKLEHYEIATYGSLVQLARTMGNEDIISLLEETLSEEKNGDELLTGLAEAIINSAATGVGEKKTKDTQKVAAVYDSVNLTGKNQRK